MKTRFIALAALLLATAAPAQAQLLDRIFAGETASHVLADDTSKALICVYVGTTGNGYITVSAAGDILFESPDSSTANTHIECDASIAADGSRNGTIDVSVGACDTLGEIVNIVNKPESDFRCAIYAGLGTDQAGPSGTGFILAASDQLADGPNGYAILWDTTAAKHQTAVVAPPGISDLANHWFPGATARGALGFLNTEFLDTRQRLWGVNATSTYGSGTSLLYVYNVAGRNGYPYSETVTQLWGPEAGGATTVAKTFGTCDTAATGCAPAWGAMGLASRKTSGPNKLIVRLVNADAMSATSLQINGTFSQE